MPVDYLPFWEVNKFDRAGRALLDADAVRRWAPLECDVAPEHPVPVAAVIFAIGASPAPGV